MVHRALAPSGVPLPVQAQEPVREDSLVVIEGPWWPTAASVRCPGPTWSSWTRDAGLVPGLDTLRVTHLDFRSDPLAVVIAPGGRHRVELAVAYPLATLEQLVVVVRGRQAERMRGFERRRRAEMGSHIGGEEIERLKPPGLSWMLRRLPRVRLRADGRFLLDTRGVTGMALRDARSITGESIRVMRDTGTCRPTIFVDGEPQDPLTEVYDIRPEEVAGVEVYHSPFVPARFSAFREWCSRKGR